MSANVDEEEREEQHEEEEEEENNADENTRQRTTKATKKKAKKALSKSARAGLVWSVAKTAGRMKSARPKEARVSGESAVYLSGVIEYVAREILAKMNDSCINDGNRKTLHVKDVIHAIRNDPAIHGCYAWMKIFNGVAAKSIAKKSSKLKAVSKAIETFA